MTAKHGAIIAALIATGLLIALVVVVFGAETEGSDLEGVVNIDGSSTVYPITEAVAEEFVRIHPNVHVSVGFSGTGGGLAKFCTGEVDIANASREIGEDEIELCEENDVEFTEFAVAIDGISVVVNPDNDWVECLTTEQLELMFRPDSPVETWADVNADWPDEEITFFMPGTDSGTFDYFTEVIVGEEDATRTESIVTTEDDNVLVQGVEGDLYAIGYFGYAYYIENQERLKALAIDNGEGGCVPPTDETIQSGTYEPLSRPLRIYVSNSSLEEEPAVAEFVQFYLAEGVQLVPDVGYVLLPEDIYEQQLETLESLVDAPVSG